MKIVIRCWILLILFIASCAQESKQAEEVDKQFINFLTQELNFDMKSKGRWVVVVLQGSSCSCKNANHLFINSLISKFQNINFIIITKNDVNNRIKNNIIMQPNILNYFKDDEQLLEKHGNILITDKIFIFEDGIFTQTLGLAKDNYEKVEDAFNSFTTENE